MALGISLESCLGILMRLGASGKEDDIVHYGFLVGEDRIEYLYMHRFAGEKRSCAALFC